MFSDERFLDGLVGDDAITRMQPQQFDDLPFGAIKLDAAGKVLLFSEYEAASARCNAGDAIGRSYFDEVAPCTNDESFRGQLERLVTSGGRDARIDYEFDHPWGRRPVRVQFWLPTPDERWIFVLPRR